MTLPLPLAQVILLLVVLQRLAELAHARRNTRRLLDQGAHEIGAAHYPLFMLLHGAWLITLFVRVGDSAAISLPLILVFLVLQLGRLWVVLALGPYWTTRIITLPGAPLVRRGPYRFLKHPNYLIVVAEILLLPLALGDWQSATVFSILNLCLLWWRVRLEDEALRDRRQSFYV